eukprot:SAG31_NODE_40678_length_279_cov_1.144444_1_plen_21_part_10
MYMFHFPKFNALVGPAAERYR